MEPQAEGKVFVLLILLRIKFPNIFQGALWVNKHKREIVEHAGTRWASQAGTMQPASGSHGSTDL